MFTRILRGAPAISRNTFAETPSDEKSLTRPDTVTAPDTVWAVTRPSWSRTENSPLTPFSARSPTSESTTRSPLTVLSTASPWTPETSALAETTPSFTATFLGTSRLTSARALESNARIVVSQSSQRSWGWSISSRPPLTATLSGRPETECTSILAPGSSCATTSTCPPIRPIFRRSTPSTSMVRGPSTSHSSSVMPSS